ncbi:MAG: polyprenyl synthetase family protein [Chloroflexi bacterium]|nr:polyprenyl synthetase family protein [Chloroflexota bacterium]
MDLAQTPPTLEAIYTPIQAELALVETRLRALAGQADPAMKPLVEYIASGGGKRVRPAVTILASRFHPNDGSLAVTMGAAVELLHAASLVHDDSVDNASVRRGLATVSSLWGDGVAVLLGDYLFATSAVLVCETGNIRVVRRFADTIREIATGELMESFGAFQTTHTMEEYAHRISLKTGSLFRTAAECGAILSGAPEPVVQALVEYGNALGMAFQIVDDILDFEGTEAELGKPAGHDLLQGTLTLPAMLLLERYPQDNPVVKLFQREDMEANRERAIDMVRNSEIIYDSYAVARRYLDTAAAAISALPDTAERRSLLDLLDYAGERRV